MGTTKVKAEQVLDGTLKDADISSDAAIAISKIALPSTLTDKATPVDGDYIPLGDSAASGIWKKLSWANIKATLKTYFDGIYITGSLPIIKTKSANQEVQNSTTLVDDTHLYFTAEANSTYAIQIQLILRSLTGSNGGIKMSVNAPAGSTVEIGSLTVFGDPTTHITAGYNSGIDAYVLGTQSGSGGTSEGSARVTVQVVTSSTIGTIQFRFAQASADNAGAIRVNKGSQLIAFKQ